MRADSQPQALSGGPRIRIARATDVPGILALIRPYYAEDGYPFESRRAARVLRAFLRRPAWGRAWVVTPGRRRIVGYAVVTLGYSLEHGGRDAFLDEIVVAPELRGRESAGGSCSRPRPIAPGRASPRSISRSSGGIGEPSRCIGRPGSARPVICS